ncbi:MAG: hypothetical protein L3J24_09490 [Xanthomonadales bacterium]|nr:hypothetical protein [Xanthomonadales bacterium]
MKKFKTVAVSIIVVFIGAFVVYNYYSEPEVVADQLGIDQGVSAGTTDKVTQIKPANKRPSKTKHSAKQFYESILKTTTPVLSDGIVGQAYAEKLNAALAGDLMIALEISNFQNKCNRLELQEQMLDTTTLTIPRQVSDTEVKQEIHYLENLKYKRFMQTKKQCMEAFDGDFESDLGMLSRHDELYQQALAGNVMAKYIYAVQTHSEHYLTELFLLGIDYAAIALTFTNENLMERPDLGLLAYAHSYSTGGQFTPKRISVGMAYFIAAVLCGADPGIVNSFPVSNFLATKATVSYLAPIEKILTLADTLSQQHCPA